MTNIVAIKKEKHQKLTVSKQRTLAHTSEQHIAPITAVEFSQAAANFPVVIVKVPESDRYRSVVMLGLETGENLFYSDDLWQALYVPQGLAMEPFVLGLDPEEEKTLTACVNLNSPFIGEDKELALFDDKGEESEVLKNIHKSLGSLYDGEVLTDKFITELRENDLLQELELNINMATGENKKLVGIFSINEEKLQKLSDEKVLDFYKRGFFIPIYAMLGSVSQINRLVQLRNKQSDNKINGIQINPIKVEDKK